MRVRQQYRTDTRAFKTTCDAHTSQKQSELVRAIGVRPQVLDVLDACSETCLVDGTMLKIAPAARPTARSFFGMNDHVMANHIIKILYGVDRDRKIAGHSVKPTLPAHQARIKALTAPVSARKLPLNQLLPFIISSTESDRSLIGQTAYDSSSCMFHISTKEFLPQ
ncbi:hypothetical protein CBL_07367 [Carabus blaptoides fortunei]